MKLRRAVANFITCQLQQKATLASILSPLGRQQAELGVGGEGKAPITDPTCRGPAVRERALQKNSS